MALNPKVPSKELVAQNAYFARGKGHAPSMALQGLMAHVL